MDSSLQSELEDRLLAQEARLDAQAVLIHGLTKRLVELEERLKEVEHWQDREDSYQLEQSEYSA